MVQLGAKRDTGRAGRCSGPACVFLFVLYRSSGVALHELGLEHDFLLRHIRGVGLAQQQLNRLLGHLGNRLQYRR